MILCRGLLSSCGLSAHFLIVCLFDLFLYRHDAVVQFFASSQQLPIILRKSPPPHRHAWHKSSSSNAQNQKSKNLGGGNVNARTEKETHK